MNRYKVVASKYFHQFIEQCNAAVEEGFLPLGGITTRGSDEYLQSFLLGEKNGSTEAPNNTTPEEIKPSVSRRGRPRKKS